MKDKWYHLGVFGISIAALLALILTGHDAHVLDSVLAGLIGGSGTVGLGKIITKWPTKGGPP